MAPRGADDLVGELLGLAMGEGWGAIDGVEKRLRTLNDAEATRQQERAIIERATLAEGLSDDPARRQRFLVLLLRKTLLRGPSIEEQTAATAEAYAIAKARREGENGIVLMLMSALADDGDTDGETA